MDTNLELAISDVPQVLTYFIFDDPALNTFDPTLKNERLRLTNYKVVQEMRIQTCTLAQVLKDHLPRNTVIDFLSVDVEGLDLAVLRSNDWAQFRPRLILVECLESELTDPLANPTASFLDEHGYAPFAKTYNTWFFRDRSSFTD